MDYEEADKQALKDALIAMGTCPKCRGELDAEGYCEHCDQDYAD